MENSALRRDDFGCRPGICTDRRHEGRPQRLGEGATMARVSTYLNFQGQTEEAFAYYAKIFGTQVTMLSRYSDMPAAAGPQAIPPVEQGLILHAELPILA